VKKGFWSGVLAALVITAVLLTLDHLSISPDLLSLKPSPIIRVRLPQRNSQQAVFLSENGFELSSSEGKTLVFKPRQTLTIELKNGSFHFDKVNIKAGELKLNPKSKHIHFNGHQLEGQLSIHRSEDEQSFFTVLHSELEPYVARVVMAEMPQHWHHEALRTQAIAARSFAVHHINKASSRPYDLYGDARAQAFSLKAPSKKSIFAAASSQGLILYQNQKPLLSYYISTCGGQTKQHHQGHTHYPSVTCEDCDHSPHYQWTCHVPIKMLAALMGDKWEKGASLKSLKLNKAKSGHAETIVLTPDHGPTLSLGALDLRRGINRSLGKGKEIVKSLMWDCDVVEDGLFIKGKGWGYHGIGMCQYGGQGRAKQGWLSTDILKSYYPKASISKYTSSAPSPLSRL
jgi:stage II sporulation protein D